MEDDGTGCAPDGCDGGPGDAAPPLVRRLLVAAQHTRTLFAQRLEDAGGDLTGYLVGCALADGRPRPQRALARGTEVSEATIARQVDGMERDGLVTRTRPPGDRRVVLVALTARGRERHERLTAVAAALDSELTDALGAAGRAELDALLAQVAQVAVGDARPPTGT